jgi:trehalose-6-phosphate synthase
MSSSILHHPQSQNSLTTSISGVSLLSVKRDLYSKTIANLPYRTVHIDTHTSQVRTDSIKHDNVAEDCGHDDSDQDMENHNEFTDDGVRIDTWNHANGYSFYPYTIREQLNKQNKNRKKLISRFTSFNSQNTDTTASINPKDALYLQNRQQQQQLEENQNQEQQPLQSLQPSSLSSPNSNSKEQQQQQPYPPRMNTKVSFSNLVEIPSSTSNIDQAQADPDAESNDDSNSDFGSTISSVTMTPNLGGTSSHASLKSAFNRRQRQRIFFVCFHLPIILTHDNDNNEWKAIWGESLLAATEGSTVTRDYDPHWIGTVSCSSHSIQPEDRDAITEVLAHMNCTPLFLDATQQDMHYKGMCKQVLWPAFHNVDLLDLSTSGLARGVTKTNDGIDSGCDWDQSRLDAWWRAYQDVNAAFGDQLAQVLNAGDIMWVHDYHLSLLPKIVDDRERADLGRSVTKKVFLLHIPFPTSQIFHELECGEEILKAMLHADVVGFHAFDHARHFLNATKRILGLNHESLTGGLIGIKIGRKTVLVTMHNVSVEPYQLEGTCMCFDALSLFMID